MRQCCVSVAYEALFGNESPSLHTHYFVFFVFYGGLVNCGALKCLDRKIGLLGIITTNVKTDLTSPK